MMHPEDILLGGKYENNINNRLGGCKKAFERRKLRVKK